MDNIEHFEDIKQGFEELNYNDEPELDKLSRRLGMFIKKALSEQSEYLTDFQNLTFIHISLYIDEEYAKELWEIDRRKAVNLINTIIEELSLFSKNMNVDTEISVDSKIDRSKVFIVHGHDDGAKETVARFVDKLGFRAIVLHEQVDSGATIIEKLEKHTDVGFAIVLYTACDVGGVKSEQDNLKPRARQNVVFEHGLLIGKIGREDVVALVKGNVEIPNDISGVVYKSMDTGGAWKYSIAREMKSSGYDVDMNKIE